MNHLVVHPSFIIIWGELCIPMFWVFFFNLENQERVQQPGVLYEVLWKIINGRPLKLLFISDLKQVLWTWWGSKGAWEALCHVTDFDVWQPWYVGLQQNFCEDSTSMETFMLHMHKHMHNTYAYPSPDSDIWGIESFKSTASLCRVQWKSPLPDHTFTFLIFSLLYWNPAPLGSIRASLAPPPCCGKWALCLVNLLHFLGNNYFLTLKKGGF